jgi:hypothetical protein
MNKALLKFFTLPVSSSCKFGLDYRESDIIRISTDLAESVSIYLKIDVKFRISYS